MFELFSFALMAIFIFVAAIVLTAGLKTVCDNWNGNCSKIADEINKRLNVQFSGNFYSARAASFLDVWC